MEGEGGGGRYTAGRPPVSYLLPNVLKLFYALCHSLEAALYLSWGADRGESVREGTGSQGAERRGSRKERAAAAASSSQGYLVAFSCPP